MNRKSQQQIEDGAAVLAGMFTLAENLAAGRVDVDAAIAGVRAQRIDTVRRWGHALDVDARYGDTVAELDTILGAYNATTTAYSMGACLAEVERACLAFDDAFDVLHGRE
jgi:hypothetical protein